nr:uncharacterized protein LOC128687017 [Cherax quadricarinatus]
MWTTWVLVCVVVLAWLHDTHGTYFISGREYSGVLPRSILTSNIIAKQTLQAGGKLNAAGLLECSRLCIATAACSSIIIQTATNTCYLTSLDRCSQPGNLLLVSPGYFYYERFDGQSISPPTCYSRCYQASGCEKCGRQFCWGWQIPNKVKGPALIWSFDLTSVLEVHCDNNWQLLWKSGDSSPRNTPPEPLQLKLFFRYIGDSKAESLFSSVSSVSGMLTVGSYVGGNGGNWWNAPFENRALAYNSSQNCKPFFNPTSECEANNITAAEEQISLSGNVTERGFAWLTGNQTLDHLTLSSIELWMTCTTCPVVSKYGK